jgi:3-dehydroquinate dehydratase/shikimate dehydrogenase
MKLVVTIYEETFDAALGAIRACGAGNPAGGDMVELRAERFGAIDLQALRDATAKPVILTYRGAEARGAREALEAGIDFIDVEWREDLQIDLPRERVVLSHHDYEAMPDVEPFLAKMRSFGCAHTKLAVTPKTLDDNLRLLRSIEPGTTIIGMGERGLYSRILAPFRGSELTFVAASKGAAPGQLTLDRALQIYGSERESLHATHVFAIAGNPAGHSLSPAIHNPLFREKEVDAAYTIASFDSFDEIVRAFEQGEIRGLSITAPFKEEAFAWAERAGAHVRHNAREAGSVNTLVTMRDGCVVADNTDVDGFASLIDDARSVAIVGAGGTARAALVALKRAGAKVRVFNRSLRPFPYEVEPIAAVKRFDGDLLINTLPHGAEVDLPRGIRVIEAKYSGAAGSGFDLLRAQAVRQNELFVEALS